MIQGMAQALARYKKLHVRVSIKGDNKALAHLIDAGASCNACLISSLSDEEGIKRVLQNE
jgi:hypothetical protein